MAAERVMDEFAAKQGWNEASQLALALQYIDNQADDAAFKDFLAQQADAEEEFVAEPQEQDEEKPNGTST